VTLRDTWGVQSDSKQEKGRSRGSGGGEQQQNVNGCTGGVVEDIRRVAFRAATILEVNKHPEVDTLLVCRLDCGDVDENGASVQRTVVAGLGGKIPDDKLVGRKIVAVTNLKPAKMRGIESEAMLIAAAEIEGDVEKVELLLVPDEVPNGELLSVEGKETSEPDLMMKSKGALKAFDRVKAALKANAAGEATWQDESGSTFRLLTSKGPVKTETLKNAVIG
jgi:methionine--tRNA ligase beta chain